MVCEGILPKTRSTKVGDRKGGETPGEDTKFSLGSPLKDSPTSSEGGPTSG